MSKSCKRVRNSLVPVQGKRVKEFDYWRVCQENQHLAKKNNQLRVDVRKLMDKRIEAGHRVEKSKLAVIDLVSRFEQIKEKVEEASEITELVKSMEVKLNIHGDDNTNIHNTAFVMDENDEDKENQDPSRVSTFIPINQTQTYIPRIADCSIYGFDD